METSAFVSTLIYSLNLLRFVCTFFSVSAPSSEIVQTIYYSICFTLQRHGVPWKTLGLIQPELMWALWVPQAERKEKEAEASLYEKCLLLSSNEGTISRPVSESTGAKNLRLNNLDNISSVWEEVAIYIKVHSVIGTVSTEGRHHGGNNLMSHQQNTARLFLRCCFGHKSHCFGKL